MACILVFILHKSKAYSFMHRQIVLLHVQSKRRADMAALQPLHDLGRNSVMIFSAFPVVRPRASLFCDSLSYSASAKWVSGCGGGCGNPLADVRFSC
jgi:hypothetical protein